MPLRALSLATAVLLLGVLVAVGVRVAHAGDVLPGTEVSGIDLGGETERAAIEQIRRAAARPIVLRDGVRRFDVTPAAAGFDVDAAATVDRAMQSGRSGLLDGLPATVGGLVATREVEPVVRTDAVRLRRAIGRVAMQIGRRADDGALTVDPETLAVRVSRPRAGRSLDRARLARLLRAAVLGRGRVVDVPVRELPAADPDEVRAVARDAERYLDAPLVVDAGQRTVELEPARVAPLLRLVRGDAGVRLGTDTERARALVAEIAADVDRPARPPRFSASSAATLDDKGDVSWRPRRASVTARGGRTGRELDRAKAVSAIAAAIGERRHRASAELREVQPAVSLEAARRVKHLIGTFTTYYEAGQPRVQNIRRIARTVDGTVIPPGGQFSLNGVSGPRTAEKGYVKAPFIADGKIVPSVGGGVSQFSTTMYNAAFFAGLPLDAATPHSLFIDRYPAGRESTLNFPDIDLRWTNDTQAPVVVRTSSDATSVTVRLFGDNDGRRVRSVSGEREPIPGEDFAVTVTRIIEHADGREVEQPRTTRYDKPAPEDE